MTEISALLIAQLVGAPAAPAPIQRPSTPPVVLQRPAAQRAPAEVTPTLPAPETAPTPAQEPAPALVAPTPAEPEPAEPQAAEPEPADTEPELALELDPAEADAFELGGGDVTEDTFAADHHRHRARGMVSAGGVALVAAGMLFVGAAVEGSKPKCKFGGDDCAAAPRPKMVTGLAVSGAFLSLAGAALVGVGLRRLRRIRAQPLFDQQSAGVAVSGRF